MATTDPRVLAKMNGIATPMLVQTLRIADAQTTEEIAKHVPNPELRQARAWMIQELERRFPAASDAVQAAFDAAELAGGDDEVDYVAVLLANIPA